MTGLCVLLSPETEKYHVMGLAQGEGARLSLVFHNRFSSRDLFSLSIRFSAHVRERGHPTSQSSKSLTETSYNTQDEMIRSVDCPHHSHIIQFVCSTVNICKCQSKYLEIKGLCEEQTNYYHRPLVEWRRERRSCYYLTSRLGLSFCWSFHSYYGVRRQ